MLSPLSNTYRLHESSVSIYQIDASSPEYLIASVVAGAKIQVSPDLLTSNPSYAKNGVPKPIGYDVSLEARRWSFSGNNIKLNNLYVDKKLNIYIRLDATPVTGSTGLIVITPNDYDIDGYFIEKIEEDGSAASSVVAETTRTEEDGVEEVLNRPGYRYVMENVGSEEEPDMQKKQKDSDYFYICIGNIYTENGLRKYVIDNGSYNTQYQIDKDKDSNAMFELTKSLSGNHVIRPLMPFLELTIDGTLTIGGVAVNSIINDDQMQKFVKAWNDNKPSDMEDWTLDETIVTTQALITYITYITSHFLRKDAPDATPYALGVGSLVSAGDMSAAGSISSSAKVLTPVIESSNDDKVLYAKDIIDVVKRVVADAVSAHFSNDLSLNGKVYIDAEGGMRHADFTPDIITGQRWSLNGMGEGEFESLVLRSFLRVPMLDFNKVTVSSGTSWNAPGCGVIKSVGVGDDGCDFFDIKLERGEIGSFAKGDICMGVWHFEGEDSRLNASDGDAKNDDSGTSVAGFCKVLFMITEVEDYVADGVSYANGRCHVGYRLLDGSAHGHVAESMTVVAYGHDITLDSVPGRLSSEQVNGDNFMFPDELDFMSNERTRSWYKTTKFQRYLVNMNGGTFMHLRDKNNAYVEDDGVSYNDESKYRIEVLDGKRYVFVRYKKSKWDIAFPYNVGMHLGDTTDMYVDDVKTGGKVALSNYSAFLSNVYFYGFLQHIDISQLSDTEGLLASTNYQVDLTSASATVNVDADGGLQLFDETGRALVQTAVYVHRGDSPMIYIDDFSDAAWSKEAERLGLAAVSEKDRRNYYRLMVAVDGIGSLDSQGALIEGSGYSKEGTSVTVKAILASAVAKGSASVTFTVLPYKSDVALQKIFFIKFTYDGSVGLSVFTSYVFKRFTWGLSADSIAVPEGGSFTSPLPDGGEWSDSIPEGEGEVWMAQRRFYSDGSEADGGEHANAWVLARMTDTEFLDVEFTAAAEYKPLLYADGSPVHGNSEKALARKKQLGWVEAVDGANAVWMATSHYSDGKWSEWNYVKVKGENGDPGLSVFTSYVFKRFAIGTSADSIAVPEGGSFTSPLPSTGGWSDSIPEGEGEVWMAQRRFYSDGSEADGGEHANAWVLARMTDTEFLDVEFTAAAEYKPLLYADGTPVHGNSEEALARKKQLGWVEAVDGANAIWMATSHYADGKWSEWNYVKVKGENGDPGVSVFTSYVFKRFAIGTSADSITVPEGGSFSSPLPSTGGWSDSIPEGEGEVWMAQRRFYSDGSEADGGEHANAWVLARMTDTEFLDVEFTAAAEYKPLLYADGTPVHGNSEKALARKKQLGWVEAVDGANAIWMATSHYSDGKWSEWNYVKVKGENGDPGLSVFTSYVFKRFAIGTSADSIAVPEGGSFSSPLPSTGGWTDSIPEGEGEVWMAQRRFYSDGSEADGGEHANAWVLARMTDTEFLDVEFTAAAEYKPLLYADGTPVHGNSEEALARKKQLGWVEAVDGANAIWMATSHYADGKWSEWNYVKVKGENGDPGVSVFTSYVFKRFAIGTSADSIAVPEGGSFTSPLPSTGGWSDSIPEGEGEVWMAQRRFYSDGSEADGGEHANAWVLARMTDTEFLDVEFTAAAEYKPLLYADGSPVHGNSEKALARKKQLGWVEAVDGANAVWMATSHYADGKWSTWNYVKVKGEDGEPGDDGLPGLPGVSALTASVTPSSIVIDCDSEGRSKEAGSRTFSFHVFDGDSQTESYSVAYGSIASCFQLNASLNKLAWSKGSSIVSASIDISISCKDRTVHLSVPVVANKQGASSLGQLSKMARNRGAFSSLQTYFNNEFWSDYVRVGSSFIFFLGDSVERWDGREGKYYFKGGSGLATESLYPSASASGDIMDGGRVIWKRVSNVGDLAAGRIIADSINSGNANIGEVFIGKTSTGAVDIQGGVSVDDSADGWLIQSGRIVHTKTGLSLTADGYLDNPDGLHLSVSGSPTNAVLPPSANMLPDPILNNPRHFGYDEGKKAIPVHGIGTTSSDEFWATSLVQTGSSSTFLNFTSPWADDGGRVVSLHFGADYVPSQSKYVYTQYVKSNRVAILTSIPLGGSSDMKQRNIYTFSVWAKNASADFLFNTLVEARVFVSALGNECSWIYLGIERSSCGGGVRMIASGIASEIDGWVQHYVTFEVVFGSSAQSGSATYADKAYFDWMPYVNAKKKNMYVSFAGAKLEKGDKPTPMTYLSGSLKRAGIDILKGVIVLTADKFLCQNLEGEKTAWLDDTGVFIANGVFTSPVNIIDWNNNVGRDKVIVAFKNADGNFLGYLDNDGNYRLMSGDISDKDEWVIEETVVYLDVLRLGDTVKILSLPADAIGSGLSDTRYLELPYYIDEELNCRTLTRLNGKSDSVPRLITGDEMRMLGGKRITLLLKDAVPTPYTLAQCFFLSYASSYMSPDLQTANAAYVYKYPVNGMIYDNSSGMKLNGDRVVTLECRAAFFYDDSVVGSGNKSCYGYAWVSSRDETLTQYGNSLDNWN